MQSLHFSIFFLLSGSKLRGEKHLLEDLDFSVPCFLPTCHSSLQEIFFICFFFSFWLPLKYPCAGGTPIPHEYLPVLPGTMQPCGFYQLSSSASPYKECNLSCTSLPPWPDSWQSTASHFPPALSSSIWHSGAGCVPLPSSFPCPIPGACLAFGSFQHCSLS